MSDPYQQLEQLEQERDQLRRDLENSETANKAVRIEMEAQRARAEACALALNAMSQQLAVTRVDHAERITKMAAQIALLRRTRT